MKKTFLTLLAILSLTLIIFAMTTTVSATEITSGDCGAEGDNVTWSFDADTGVLSIEGEGAMVDYFNNGYNDNGGPWRPLADSITEISIGDGVTHIGDNAFIALSNVKHLEIPDSVLSIGKYAFAACEGLRTVDIGDGVQKIGDRAFQNCWNIYQLTLGAGLGTDTSEPFPMGYYAFSDSNLLVEIYDLAPMYYVQQVANDWVGHSALVIHTDATSASRIITDENGYVFYYYDDGTNVTAYLLDYVGEDIELVLPEHVKENNYRIYSNAFRNRKGITSVTIPETVSALRANAFAGCSAVETDEYGVQYIDKWLIRCPVAASECVIRDDTVGLADEAFKNCSLIEEIAIPDSVVHLDKSVFQSCTSLKSIVIGDGVVRVGWNAFAYCTALESITVGKCLTAWGSCATDGCSSLNAIYISDLTAWCKITFENGYNPLWEAGNLYLNGNLVTALVIPEEITEIKKSAFAGASCIESITIHDNVTSIGSSAFSGCVNLEELTVPFIGASIDAEYDNNKLTYLVGTVPDSLRSVKITAATSIGREAFKGCKYIMWVELPETLTKIENEAFYGCTSLVRIELPANLAYIGSSAFGNCQRLIEVRNLSSKDINPSSTTSKVAAYAKHIYGEDGESKIVTVDDYVFYCDDDNQEYYLIAYIGNDAEITLPDKVDDNNYEIYAYAFANCESITKVTIPETVTAIGDYAFQYTNNLTDVSVPSTIEKFGAYVFKVQNINTTTQYDNAWYIGNDKDPYVVLLKSIDDTITSCEIHSDTKIIYSQAFSDCEALESITFPKKVTTIGDKAFYRCLAITEITIPDNVKYIGEEAFVYCSALTTLTVGDGVESVAMSYSVAFDYCYALKTVTAPTIILKHLNSVVIESITVTSGTELDKNSFDDRLSSLTTLNLPDTITKVGPETFEGLTALTYNEYEGGKYFGSESNPYMILIVGINDNYDIESFTIHADTKFIYDEAFESAYALKEIVIPDSVISIGNNVFDGCSALSSVTIGQNVTTIGDYAFYYCNYLEKIFLPESIEYIGYYVINTYNTDVIYCGENWDAVSGGENITVQLHEIEFVIDGDKHYTKCAYCDFTSDPIDHEYDSGTITKDPEHEVAGEMTYTCECGHIKIEEIEALEHSFGEFPVLTKAATHTEEGIYTYYCICGAEKTESIPKLEEHVWGSGSITTYPTHLEEGVKTYTCECGETKTEAVDKLTEHTYGDGIVTKEATHLEDGVMTYTCECGETYTETLERLYYEHEWGTAEITLEPTHTQEGVKTYTCACGDVYTEPINKLEEHEWDDGTVSFEPDHFTEGTKTYLCSCGESYSESIPKLEEHVFGEWKQHSENQHIRECPCGEQELENHAFDSDSDDMCDKCGFKRNVEVKTELMPLPGTDDPSTPDNKDENDSNSQAGCGASVSGIAVLIMSIIVGFVSISGKKKAKH